MVSKKSNRSRRIRRSRKQGKNSRKNSRKISRRKSRNQRKRNSRRRNSRKSQKGGFIQPLDTSDVYSKYPGINYPQEAINKSEFTCNYSGVYGGGAKNKRRYSAKAGGIIDKIGSGFKKLMEPTASLNSVISDFKEQDRVSAETLNGLQSELGKLGGEVGNLGQVPGNGNSSQEHGNLSQVPGNGNSSQELGNLNQVPGNGNSSQAPGNANLSNEATVLSNPNSGK